MALTDFQRRRLVAEGFPPDRIRVVPNMARDPGPQSAPSVGDCVGFVGRLSPEKGLPTLIAAARDCPDIPFKVAGEWQGMPALVARAPRNVELLGHLGAERLAALYARIRILVVCSTCFEGFPTVLPEAMLRGKPAVCSRIGGLPEIVDDGATGLLFEPGRADDLAAKLRSLWRRPARCRALGRAARSKALREYSPPQHYGRLMDAYRTALAPSPEAGRRRKRAG
jgi:glycosyltransferase involved in cell wall biosynthesis